MVLCFGVFAQILNHCSQAFQYKLVPRIAWVVDRRHSSLAATLDFEVKDDDLDTMEGNPTVVSKLLHCTLAFELSGESLPSVEVAAERFKAKVMPFIDSDKIGKAVLAVLYIIFKDKAISTERKETFREYFGMYKDELVWQEKIIDVPDFFARVLLYTTCVDNKEGEPCAKQITKDFIEEIANKSWAELKWDVATQTVELIPTEQQRLWDEIAMISDLRLSMGKMEDEVYADIDWLGIDKCALFPNKYRRIEFNDPETKKAVIDKMVRYRKLVQGLTDYLIAGQQSAKNKIARWPIFPDERIRNIRQQIKDLGEELELDLLKASIGF